MAQAGRDLDVHENILRKWAKEFGADPVQAFPGHGQMKPEQQEIDRLRREVAKLETERDILKKAAATKRSASKRRPASLPAIGPTALGASSETFWRPASNAACTGSNY